jgi:signal transduction histidine kinase/ligand-binding sensor domain-containing protein
MKRSLCWITLSLLSTLAIPAAAQAPVGGLTRYTELEGLPGHQVNQVLQDQFGYIWTGTINGLARYDGYRFERFLDDPNDPASMKGLIVWSMFEDRSGLIWVAASPERLNVYDPVSNSFRLIEFKHLIDVPPSVEIGITAMCQDNRGRIYLGVFASWHRLTSALLYFDVGDDRIRKFELPDGLEISNVVACAADSLGNVWVLNWQNLFTIDAAGRISRVDVLQKELGKNNDYLTDFKIGRDGQLWLVTNQYRLYQYNPVNKTLSFRTRLDLPGSNDSDSPINMLELDDEGNIWIGTNRGLHYYNVRAGRAEALHPEVSAQLSQVLVRHLKYDSFGTLWIGTQFDGLFKYEKKALFKSFSYNKAPGPSLTPGWANIVHEGRDGKIWIATSGQGNDSGINILDPDTESIRSFPFRTFLPNANVIFGLMEFAPNEFYLSTIFGIYHFSANDHSLRKTTLEGLPDDAFVYHFFVDSRQNVWLCSGKGLFGKLKGEDRFTRFDLSRVPGSDESSNHVTKAHESEKHGLWLLTNNGLFSYDYAGGQLRRHGFDPDKGNVFLTQDINSFYEAPDGTAWVGTWQGGLSRYTVETGEIETFTRNEGLPSMSIQGMLADEERNLLWLSTFEGLCRFNMKTGQVHNFSLADGIQGQLFADGAYLKTGKDLFIFGGSNGITAFRSEDVDKGSLPPRVVLTGFRINNQPVVAGEESVLKRPLYETREIVLQHHQNSLSLEYTALHYSDPAKNRCLYRLINYDPDWRESGGQFAAAYSLLPPGKYTFQVKAANNHGVWNEEGVSVRIVVLPPWWKTTPAYLFYILVIAAGVFGADRYFRSRVIRRERQGAQLRELEQAREIEKAYTELKATQSQLIQAEKMASLGELTAGIAHEIQNPLNFVNNFSEVNIELMEELKAESSKLKGERDKALEEELWRDLQENEMKINHHGRRADAIVKSMLQHSRSSNGQKEPTDINALADEYLRLAYHGLRARDKSFNAEFKTAFDPELPVVPVVPQDIGRVLLNLINNAFYAVDQRARQGQDEKYIPTVTVGTRAVDGKIEVRVADNGPGIPEHIRDKIFQPFFTTKPTGEGTGLGLSLSYDIITKGHNGRLEVDTAAGQGSEFIVQLPIV